ncbi:hypothetical protein CEUSTIGMA_g10157.t1 [Chlamydomonas eustigma]|uniref:Xaa-Pro dipeptidyl-peptidase-like domain-containing protein n=1 Tax=Chlamydomonas eustigma TaxID=1157962 RepID=A0A250XI25_9CHLO|nr:hypothetical protein CEUSTIGMA_g10157.t1 [Chlamydomonas eustigma]|eukprot:GAX82731.1 hypothetical protein CEUSTIGMA_g10157.t1 [Chlamydomonas eustigma]
MKFLHTRNLTLIAFVAVIASLASLPWETEVKIGFFRNQSHLPHNAQLKEEGFQRKTIRLNSHGVGVEAWLYTPIQNSRDGHPVIVMAHGLGCQKDMGLHAYAVQFVLAGFAVVAFDHRTFGGSDGEPRQLVKWWRHVEDWVAVVNDIKNGVLGHDINPTKIGLWGVSYSGGQVLATAAKLGDTVSAVVALEPYLSSKGRAKKLISSLGILKCLRLLAVSINDAVRDLLNLPAAYLKLSGSVNELAILQMNDAELKLLRSGGRPERIGGWQPYIPARMLLQSKGFEPLKYVDKISAPVFIRAGTEDTVCPIKYVHEAMDILTKNIGERAVLQEVPYNHIELFHVGMRDDEIEPSIKFLKKYL